MSQDLLGADPVRRPRPPGTRRRAGAVLAVLALTAGGAYLAGRSNPAPRPAVPPVATDAADRPTVPTQQTVVDVAVGTATAYALIGQCAVTPPGPCRQRLISSTGDGNWRTVTGDLPGRGPDEGFSGRLLVSGDRPSLVEDDLELVFPIEGDRYGRLPVVAGGPVPRVPAGATVELVGDTVTTFDPLTGQRHPLAVRPPVGPVRALAAYGDRIVAVGDGESALSTDRGGRWTAIPIRGLRPGASVLTVATGPGDAAYLLVGRERNPQVKNEFSELWRLAGGRWTDVTPKVRPASALSLVVPEGGLPLVTEETGGVWRLLEDGTLRRLPDAFLEGLRIKPFRLVTGPGGVLLLGEGIDLFDRTSLVSSADGGSTWSVYLPG